MGSKKRMDKHSPQKLGEKLRKIREAFADTQEEFLARLGNPESILQTSISLYERGKREPQLLILLKYAKLAKVSLEILVDDSLELPNKISAKKKI
jgi:transcriptional regulator with XRE-family HTH domain